MPAIRLPDGSHNGFLCCRCRCHPLRDQHSRGIGAFAPAVCQVLDEADRLLNMDFEQEIDQILKVVPRVRQCTLCTQRSDKGVHV